VGEGFGTPDELALAVSGLAGLIGFLALPTFGAWLRLVLDWFEEDRTGLGRPRARFSGSRFVLATTLTFALGMLVVTLVRAAGQLRAIRVEAPIVVPTVTSIAIGLAFWAVYAIGLGILRAEWQRSRLQSRPGRIEM
jgi:hypothetical protein